MIIQTYVSKIYLIRNLHIIFTNSNIKKLLRYKIQYPKKNIDFIAKIQKLDNIFNLLNGPVWMQLILCFIKNLYRYIASSRGPESSRTNYKY